VIARVFIVALVALPAAADEELGRRVYRGACAPCHGERGDGDGPGARPLDPPPRDFTSGIYKFRSTPSGALPLVEDVMRTVAEGIPGTMMPGWRDHLTDEELRAVSRRVRAFAPPPDVPVARAVPAEPRPTEVTPARMARGAHLYGALGCGECHGPSGRGDGRAARGLKDDAGRAIVPLDFTRGFYKGSARPEDVYRTFVTGLGGTPMPAFGDTLPDEEDRWALVHWVRALSRPRGAWA
jgi:cytochrome c oxidase cbb3-type subunit 2